MSWIWITLLFLTYCPNWALCILQALVTVCALPFGNKAAACSCRCLPRSFIPWQIRGDLVNGHAESWILPKHDTGSLPLCFAVVCSGVRLGHGFPVGYVNFTALHVPVKSKAWERDSVEAFFVSDFTLVSYHLEHKPWGSTSTVPPVWLWGHYCFFKYLHGQVDRKHELLLPCSSSTFRKCTLPWPPYIFYILKGETTCLLRVPHSERQPGHGPLKNFYPRAYLHCKISSGFQPRVPQPPSSALSKQRNGKLPSSYPPVAAD